MTNREIQSFCVQGTRKSHADLNGHMHDMEVLEFETSRGLYNKMQYKNLKIMHSNLKLLIIK